MQVIGIDISKNKFDVAIYNQKSLCKEFDNSSQGFTKLIQWLRRNGIDKISTCMEATGFYGEELAEFLYVSGHKVSIINPSCIKAYSISKLSRHKTDKTDAQLIAEYAYKHEVTSWKPLEPAYKELRQVNRCVEGFKLQLVQVSNRLDNKKLCAVVRESWKCLQTKLREQIKQLEQIATRLIQSNKALFLDYKNLQTIPGISQITARAILAEIPDLSSFKNARQLAAYAGLIPRQRSSGSTVRGQSRLSKLGSRNLRKLLYFPAITAKKHNVVVAAFCHKLLSKGKCKMSVICAAMRKLIHIIYGVLKHKIAFNPVISC